MPAAMGERLERDAVIAFETLEQPCDAIQPLGNSRLAELSGERNDAIAAAATIDLGWPRRSAKTSRVLNVCGSS